jgi:aminoglycoside phosphotransferase (APT) family kinase protein
MRQPTTLTGNIGALLGCGRSAEVFAWSPGWVVKLFHPNHPVAWIEQEAANAARVFDATRECDEFHTPQVGGIISVAGRHGLLYECVEGKPLVQLLNWSSSQSIHAVGTRLAELHFAIHRVRFEALGEGSGLPSQRAVIEERTVKASDLPVNVRDAARRLLTSLDTDRREDCLCHGDFHPFNVLASADDRFAVIDWEAATHGSAMADFARTLVLLEFGRTGSGQAIAPLPVRMKLRDAYLQRYCELAALSEADPQLKRWTMLAAVVRLNDGVGSAERSSLLAFVEPLLKDEMLDELLRG